MRHLCTTPIAAFYLFAVALGMTQAQTSAQPDLSKEPTLYVVGYAHLDTEWRWEYPQVINEYIRKTMEDNFKLFDKYPHYIFNFSGANRYRFMKEYFPADFAQVKKYVDEGRWFPAGSSMEEGDVNAPSAEAIIRQILYGNEWFRKEFGKASMEYMLPDCFGFPASLPTILAHSGVKGFSTQKLTWGSSANAGGRESLEETPEGTPFNVGVWVGPDGESVLAGLNPGAYSGGIDTDLSQPLPAEPANPAVADLQEKLGVVQQKIQQDEHDKHALDPKDVQQFIELRSEQEALTHAQSEGAFQRHQRDWATRVELNGKVTGLFTDYHYFGTGDIGGSPNEGSVKRLEAIVTHSSVDMPPAGGFYLRGQHQASPEVKVGDGPVHVISATADQMFLNITPAEAATLPRYTGEMELTNHSAGSLTSEAYQKRWIRQEELLADAAEKSSIAAAWLGGRTYPLQRLSDAWTLTMGAHFHDLAAGTATPRAYEFAWNDDVIAMNQFADVLKSGTEVVASALNTQTHGVPLVVFNPLNIAREDLVEAEVHFPDGMPKEVHVTAPDGKEVLAQIANDRVLFVADVPSVGYAVYDVQPGPATMQNSAAQNSSGLHVTKDELENRYYLVKLNEDGDVASIFDKQLGRELLSAPARLALSYDNPQQWPAWNMDWDQEQAPPRAYVSGPAQIRIVENGPARVALEVTRETAGSRFVQSIRLAAGDAGKRVEFGSVVDWNSREMNLKATFPLTAQNHLATYNWDIGTIDRPSAEPKKFEVPSHQWIDQTDMSGKFGVTILTDCKNGSDKPNDGTLRLTLLRTPGAAGGYPDQATQDIGHHEFMYGLVGHAGGWRDAQTDWQGQRLNAPLIPFETAKHTGALGITFSLLKVSNPRIRVLAMKKAERSDEVVVRLVELDGKPQNDVRISFSAPVIAAREVNGQEQPVGPATTADGLLTTSFGAYQPRTFAVRLAPSETKVAAVQSTPVQLAYTVATATSDGEQSAAGFDGKGDALPAEMLPADIDFNGVDFQLAQAKAGTPNAIVAKGQAIKLPAGQFNRLYVLAASADGDQKVTFDVGGKKSELNVEDWGGFVGQWDDRVWSSSEAAHGNYGQMIGLKPGFIKRADLAWYCDHHHDAAGKNIPYAYSYLFAYAIDLQPGATTLKLPNNSNVRILAISAAEENPETTPARPLLDVLPSPNAGTGDFSLSTSVQKISIPQGRTATFNVIVIPRGNLSAPVHLEASGLPAGVTASFTPASSSGSAVVTFKAGTTEAPSNAEVTITTTAGSVSHATSLTIEVTRILTGTVPVDLSSAYNVTAIYKDGSKFPEAAGIDNDGSALSAEQAGPEQVGAGVVFKVGPADVPDAVTSKTVALSAGKFSSLRMLAVGVNGSQEMQNFTIQYADGTLASFTQTLSDWSDAGGAQGESLAGEMAYRNASDGSKDANPFYTHAYIFPLEPGKAVQSISLPANRDVVVLGITLVPAD
jgi:alpha-mannosidase